jgi:cephalosporin-C deacetylase-like acetyl esterase
MRIRFPLPPLLAALVFTASVASAQTITASADRADGVYAAGDVVHWRIEATAPAGAPPAKAHYRLLRGGLTPAGEGELTFDAGRAALETKFAEPGTMLLEVTKPGAKEGEGRATAGAVAAPEKIGLSAPRPTDFREYWKAKLAELAAVPAEPKVEPVAIDTPNVSYAKVTLGNIRGSKIHGQLARPAQGEKFPAMLIVQWAGVYGLQRAWVTDRAAEGWLVLDIEAHDLPFDQPEEFYKEQAKEGGPLHDYPNIGNDDRETSYYLRMYLSCYRAAEYLTSRPDWDGRTLVVTGGSQGGMQTLVTAGIFPRITAALAMVPAGCDMLGPVVGRKGGWPHWYGNVAGKDAAKVREASRYFDVANFTPDITCPVLVGVGLRDETCPPAGIFAAFNQITAPKEIVILPKSGHQDEHGTQAAYDERANKDWLPALRAGKPAPVLH